MGQSAMSTEGSPRLGEAEKRAFPIFGLNSFERVKIKLNDKEVWRILDRETQDIYRDESWVSLACKCAAVALVSPFHLVFVSAFHAVRTTTLVVLTGVDAFKCWPGENGNRGLFLWCWTVETSSLIGEGAWEVVRAVFYTIQIEWTAAYGLIDPFQSRKLIAQQELDWHRGIPYIDPEQKRSPEEGKKMADKIETPLIERIKGLDFPYLAPCFRIRGNVHRDSIEILSTTEEERKLRNYPDKIFCWKFN
jgi:hypothetical protein